MKTTHAHNHTTHRITPAALAAAFVLALAPAFTAAPALHAQAAFEGRIDMTMTTPSARDSGQMNMVYYAKGAKVRFETTLASTGASNQEQGNLSFVTLMDMNAQQIYMLMPQQKMYMTYSFKDQKAQKTKAGETDFKPTGRTATIAGHATAEYANTDSKGTYTEMWLAKDLGSFKMVASGGAGGKMADQTAWQKYLADNNLFPLRVLQYEKKGGKLASQMDVTSVQQAPQPDSLFALPTDYTQFSLGGLLKGLGGMIPQAK